MSELVFRGLRGRTLEDQQQAMVNGYHSVTEMAVDELGALLRDLTQRVEALENQMRSAGFWANTTGELDDAS